MHVVRLGSASEGERPAETMAVYGQRTVVAPREYTKLLGLTSDEPVAERIVTVTADDQTLLASISYVPVALVDDRWTGRTRASATWH